MEFRTRHMALVAYTGIAVLVIAKDLVTAPTDLIALVAPIAGMFAWDKIDASRRKPAGE
jgi:hypothetical protein